MARNKIVKARRKSGPEKQTPVGESGILQGIWGIIFAFTGVLLFITLIFYSPQQLKGGGDHVLGPILGTSLALGLIYIFGRISVFALPAALCYIGIVKLRGREIHLKWLAFALALAVELCLLLAIVHMPKLFADGLAPTADKIGSNYVGLFMVNAMVPLFKGQTLGPYLITAVIVIITLIIALRIRVTEFIRVFPVMCARAWAWIKAGFAQFKASPSIRGKTRSWTLPVSASDDVRPESVDKKSADGDKKPYPKKRDKKVPGAEAAAGEDAPVPAEQAADYDTAAGIHPVSAQSQNGAEDNDEGVRELTPEEETESLRGRIKIHGLDTQRMEAVQEEAVPDDDGIITHYNEYESDGQPEVSPEAGGFSGDGADTAADGGDINVNVFKAPSKPYRLPSPDVIADPPPLSEMVNEESIYRNSATLEKTLRSFGIAGKVTDVSKGPVVTRYEMEIEAGTKVSKVVNLQNDISLAVGGLPVRIQAPIPGKAAIGIELPNPERQNIPFKRILTSDAFRESTADIPVVIGSTISGGSYVTDIAKTPHLLIAGTTGSGKSVCMNSIICSMLMTKTPEELRLIMIDPKVVEMANFADIPHLLAPVVHDPKEAVKALQWGVNEMERRYKLIAKSGAKKLETFNERVRNGELSEVLEEDENRPLPLIVIIIDELADLMMTASKDIEALIMRITQKARAAGIHLIVATQRPSVDIVTGKIKSNLPSRIAFRTVQAVDSRTILDRVGAEKLLGQGDMLFLRNGATDIERYHGAFISEKEVDAIVNDIRKQGVETTKIDSFHSVIQDEEDGGEGGGFGGDGDRDPMFFEAARMTVQMGQGSTSLLQTRLKVGFSRARRIMEEMEQAGIVGPAKGSKVREVLISSADLADIV
ncbi:MAG: DNA translocase FtsK [Chitinispirillia bacterium]|nr:DNA translocase FtsK [Chitinispirillia bacterium]MCL2269453.1 DNA translocase FtsK [Chitinispirillia bacterium]